MARPNPRGWEIGIVVVSGEIIQKRTADHIWASPEMLYTIVVPRKVLKNWRKHHECATNTK